METLSSSQPFKELGDVLQRAFGNREAQICLARRLFVSQVAVHNWLSGKRRPRPGHLGQLAAIYDLSPEYLAQLAGYDYDCDPEAFDKVLNAYNDRRASCLKEYSKKAVGDDTK